MACLAAPFPWRPDWFEPKTKISFGLRDVMRSGDCISFPRDCAHNAFGVYEYKRWLIRALAKRNKKYEI
jgi:hypothetical protein